MSRVKAALRKGRGQTETPLHFQSLKAVIVPFSAQLFLSVPCRSLQCLKRKAGVWGHSMFALSTKFSKQIKTSTTMITAQQLPDIKTTQEIKSEQLTQIAWHITYTALWNGADFSTAEIIKAKQFIKNFLQQENPERSYSELVQRVLLARNYILSHPGTFAPFPSQWFASENKNGFAGTLRWYQAVEISRQALPKYKQAIKAFPEAILETIQSGSAKDFHYWRSWFAEQNAQGLLNLFLATIANCRY